MYFVVIVKVNKRVQVSGRAGRREGRGGLQSVLQRELRINAFYVVIVLHIIRDGWYM
jgi:hypothetical protein